MNYEKQLTEFLHNKNGHIAHGQLLAVAVDELRHRLLQSLEIEISRARINFLVTNNALMMDFRTSPEHVNSPEDVENYSNIVRLSVHTVIKRLEQNAIETACTITEDVIINTIKKISIVIE